MTSNPDLFARAYAAWQRQDFTQTYHLLDKLEDAQSLHLRGLAARRLGKFNMAETLLFKAAELDGNNPEIYHNQSLVQLDRGLFASALKQVNEALSLRPNWPAAQQTRVRVLLNLEQWSEAKDLAEALLLETPANLILQFGRATALLELGRAKEAWLAFNTVIESGKQEPAAWFMRARAAQTLGQTDQALSDFEAALEAEPCALYLRETARLLWTMDREEDFHKLLHRPWALAETQEVAAEFLRQSGASYNDVAAAIDQQAPTVNQLAIQAWAALDASDAEQAIALAKRALDLSALHSRSVAALVTAHFMQGTSDQIVDLIDTMRLREPHGQHWIAYQQTAWRLLGDERYKEQSNFEHLVQQYELPLPVGYDSLTEFNQTLERSLLALHNHRRHPLDQSLRGGSQTRRDLSGESDPVIKQYLAALDDPIKRYLEHIGDHPAHPLSARNQGAYQFAGCWSVRLDGGGHHVNHVHPQGWISSAYYVSVPESVANSRAGWIKFGEPPYATEPAITAQHWVEPKAGMLVLFPSFMWHGTEPTGGEQLRLTAPFDLVPGD